MYKHLTSPRQHKKQQINKQSHDKIDTTVYTDGRIWIKRVTQMIPVILMIDGTGVWRRGGGDKRYDHIGRK